MLMHEQLSEQIAAALLDIQAVSLSPKQLYTWASGIQSPIYCDNRITISYPRVRDLIAAGFASMISELYPDAEVIAGAATGGIPHAAWVAEKLNLPMIYVRDKAKGHGKQNRVEGVLRPGQKVVVVEDLISTGGSSLKVAEGVHEAGGQTLSVAAIFSYGFTEASDAFRQSGIPFHSLTS
ncbi:MAG: orotate phosphoribosyltransferase, partial [Paenibacillus sp. RIFOXYA1_FULL_44_5]